jgi:hypothetical protein
VSKKLIDDLKQTALDKTKLMPARWAALSALKAMPDWRPTVDQLWELALAGITNPNPEPRKPQAQPKPVQAQHPAARTLPEEYPLNGYGDYFRRDLFIG